MELGGNQSVSFSPKSEMTQLSRSQFLSVLIDILRAMVGTLRIAQGSFLYYNIHVAYIFTRFFISFCAFLQINRQMSTFSYYRKKAVFTSTFVSTRIRIHESQINADPEHSDKVFAKNLHYL